MRSQTALKIAVVIAILSIVGAVLALMIGAAAISVAEQVGYVWVLAAAFLLQPIAEFFPARIAQIALAVALLSAVIGALCIFVYSTKHIALSLSMVAIFWQVSEGLLMRRGRLLDKTPRELYQHFKAETCELRPPVATMLGRGSMVLLLASIASLFTITTWN
jgi:hypothetical protein